MVHVESDGPFCSRTAATRLVAAGRLDPPSHTARSTALGLRLAPGDSVVVPVTLVAPFAEEVPRHVPGHLFSQHGANASRVPVVHSAVDPGVEDLLQRVGETRVAAYRAQQAGDVAVDGEADLVGPEEMLPALP